MVSQAIEKDIRAFHDICVQMCHTIHIFLLLWFHVYAFHIILPHVLISLCLAFFSCLVSSRLVSGCVGGVRHDDDEEEVITGRIPAGSVVGGISFFGGTTRGETVRAMEDRSVDASCKSMNAFGTVPYHQAVMRHAGACHV